MHRVQYVWHYVENVETAIFIVNLLIGLFIIIIVEEPTCMNS